MRRRQNPSLKRPAGLLFAAREPLPYLTEAVEKQITAQHRMLSLETIRDV